jgi:hypothetical protein
VDAHFSVQRLVTRFRVVTATAIMATKAVVVLLGTDWNDMDGIEVSGIGD